MEIRLHPNWSSSLSYDLLDHPDEAKPIFVGREQLLDPLVADVVQTEKSGAYLISGYRGSGKTSLLIEALWHAQSRSPERKPFVVVLNVSEVSASLNHGADDVDTISIDPKRLLVALLRSLRNRVGALVRDGQTVRAALLARIDEIYDKAIAASYSQSASIQRQQEVSRQSKSVSELTATAPYTAGAALAGLLALGIEAAVWQGIGPAAAHLVAAAAAVTASWSFTRSRTLSRTLSEARSAETTLRFDNSLQQLENDLKDILELLYRENFRTVVVLEELDKIDDAFGTQLDRVIRYFKNLFTQAPALFFFLADKAYFDLVESRIREARARRYYSLEHTFFTHRLYVGRPDSRDCLEYLRQAIADERFRAVIDWMTGRDGAPTPTADEELRFAGFVRAVLFRSANHLFDLKNELRRYVRVSASDGGAVALVIDERTLPDEEAALAVFQDLVEAKLRSYAFGRGRAYANEAMQDYLYGVFRDLGSALPQDVRSFHPRATVEVEVETDPSGGGTRKASIRTSLEGEEIQRIGDAVDSLITDLQRGGAFQSFRAGTFVWRRNPARNFRLGRQLEKHEQEFLRELHRLEAQLDFVVPGHPLEDRVPEAAQLFAELHWQEMEVRDGLSDLTVDETQARKDDLQVRVERAVAELYQIHLEGMKQRYGFDLDWIAGGPDGEGFYRLRQAPAPAAPDSPPSRGVQPGEFEIYLVVGELEWFAGMVPTSEKPLKRASVIQVTRRPAPNPPSAAEVWTLLHAPPPTPGDAASPATPAQPSEAPAPAEPVVSFDLLPLDERPATGKANVGSHAWGDLLGDTILFRVHWASFAAEPLADDPQVRVTSLRQDGSEAAPPERRRFSEAVIDWLQAAPPDSGAVLWLEGPPGRSVDWVLSLLGGPRFVDVAPAHPIYFSDIDGLFLGARSLAVVAHPRPIAIGREATARLLERHRLIYVGIAAPNPDEIDQAAANQLRQAVGFSSLAVLAADKLADDLLPLGVTRIELP